MIEDRYHAALSDIPEDEAKERGKAIGAACARSNLEKRANDGHREAGPPLSAGPSTPRDRRQATTSSRRPTMPRHRVHWRSDRAGGI